MNPLLLRHLKRHVDNYEALTQSIMAIGRLSDEAAIPPVVRHLFRTALEITPEQHIRMQAAFQRHVDNAVSKTVNLPADASFEDVATTFRPAHELNCKGVTIFRYGSKSDQVLQLGGSEEPLEREYFTHCDPAACKL